MFPSIRPRRCLVVWMPQARHGADISPTVIDQGRQFERHAKNFNVSWAKVRPSFPGKELIWQMIVIREVTMGSLTELKCNRIADRAFS